MADAEGSQAGVTSTSTSDDDTSTEKVESIGQLKVITSTYQNLRKRSFDDAQSRLKSRKILGLGGKESSKILQVLGNCEHLETKLPDGLSIWLTLSSMVFLIMSVGCLILFKPFSYILAVDLTSRVIVMEVRLLGATFAGLAGLTWLTNMVSYLVIRNVLLSHIIYFGLATFVFIRELFVEYNFYILLSLLFHFAVFVVTLVYVLKLQKLNQPVPDKPVSFAESDDNDNY